MTFTTRALDVFARCADGERGADIDAELSRIVRECCGVGCAICYQAGGWRRRIAADVGTKCACGGTDCDSLSRRIHYALATE